MCKEKIKEILRKIYDVRPHQIFFFSEFKNPEYFLMIYGMDFFDKAEIPDIIEDEGRISADYCSAMIYLKNIGKSFVNGDNDIKILENILETASEKIKTNGNWIVAIQIIEIIKEVYTACDIKIIEKCLTNIKDAKYNNVTIYNQFGVMTAMKKLYNDMIINKYEHIDCVIDYVMYMLIYNNDHYYHEADKFINNDILQGKPMELFNSMHKYIEIFFSAKENYIYQSYKYDIQCYYSIFQRNEYKSEYDFYDLYETFFLGVKNNSEVIECCLTALVNSIFLIIKKIAIRLIYEGSKQKNDKYISILITQIENDSDFSNLLIRHWLFEDEAKKMLPLIAESIKGNETLIDSLEKIINKGPHEEKDKSEEYMNAWLQERYRELRSIPRFQEKYNILLAVTKKDYELSPAFQSGNGGWIEQLPEYTAEQLLGYSCKQMVEKLNLFEPKEDIRELKDRSYRGQNEAIEKAIQLNADFFFNGIEDFYDIKIQFKNGIIEGFTKFINENKNHNKNVPINRIMDFCIDTIKKIIENKQYGEEAWFFDVFGKFVEGLYQTDGYATKENHDPTKTLNTILAAINHDTLDKLYNKNIDQDDLIHYTINSSMGKLLEGLLSLALWLKREEYDNWDKLWSFIKNKILDHLISENVSDVFIQLGYFYSNYQYLDKDWLNLKFQNIESINNIHGIGGYVFARTIYIDFYKLIKENIKAAFSNMNNDLPFEKKIKNRIGELAMMVMIYDKEEDDLYEYLIDQQDIYGIEGMVKYSSRYVYKKEKQKEEVEYIFSCISKLWNYILEKYLDHKEDEDKINHSEFLKIITNCVWKLDIVHEEIIRCLNDTMKIIKVTAPQHITKYISRIVVSNGNKPYVLNLCVNSIEQLLPHDYQNIWVDILRKIREDNKNVFKILLDMSYLSSEAIRDAFKDDIVNPL